MVVIIGAGAIFAVQGTNRFDQGFKLGQAIKDQVDANVGSELTRRSSEIAGNVLGEDIPVERVEIIAEMYRYGGFEEPLTRAWNDVKVQAYEKQFAEKHGLLPSEQEILDFTQDMRDIFLSDEDGRAYEKGVLDAIGLTSDEYWDNYKIKYESPAHLTKINVQNYCEENNIEPASADMIEGELTNSDLVNRFNNL